MRTAAVSVSNTRAAEEQWERTDLESRLRLALDRAGYSHKSATFRVGLLLAERLTTPERRGLWTLRVGSGMLSYPEIAAAVACTPRTVRRVLAVLAGFGLIYRPGTGRGNRTVVSWDAAALPALPANVVPLPRRRARHAQPGDNPGDARPRNRDTKGPRTGTKKGTSPAGSRGAGASETVREHEKGEKREPRRLTLAEIRAFTAPTRQQLGMTG